MLIKTSETGEIEWSKAYAAENIGMFVSMIQTADRGYALAGFSGINNLFTDMWIMKTDKSGSI
jgi:hypothetical protein